VSYYDRLNNDEKLKKLDGMIERANIKKLKLKEKERRERTRRLIEKGALLEKYFDAHHLSPEETEELLKIFSEYVKKRTPDKFKNKKKERAE
jgi:Mn-dependent DtxR family transcriptional regulator